MFYRKTTQKFYHITNMIHDIIKDYTQFIRQRIEENKVLITETSEQIEKCQKIISETGDPTKIEDFEKLQSLSQKNLEQIRKVTQHINRQEELIIQFARFSVMILNEISENDLPVLEELLSHYENTEEYEKCSYLLDKITTIKRSLDIIRRPFDSNV